MPQQCKKCNHLCKIPEGGVGICGVRKNEEGKIRLIVDETPVAINVGPIEKKPIFNYLPGTKTFSLGTVGCNFRCSNCQNYDISQIFGLKGKIKEYENQNLGEKITPEEAVGIAEKKGCKSISYTYNEPTIWVEHALKTMRKAQEKDLRNIWVSNGYMTEKTLEEILPYLDAINVDLKSFSEDFYEKNCGAKLSPILENLKKMKKEGVHLEITTLIIPTLSDDEKMLEELASFLKDEIGEETPWHISAFTGSISWKLQNIPDTNIEKLEEVYDIGKKVGLKYIYTGNIPGSGLENTYCPECGEMVISRAGYYIQNYLEKNNCYNCKKQII